MAPAHLEMLDSQSKFRAILCPDQSRQLISVSLTTLNDLGTIRRNMNTSLQLLRLLFIPNHHDPSARSSETKGTEEVVAVLASGSVHIFYLVTDLELNVSFLGVVDLKLTLNLPSAIVPA